MHRQIKILFLFLIIVAKSFAQDADSTMNADSTEGYYGIGGAVGTTIGFGPSVRYYHGKKTIQITHTFYKENKQSGYNMIGMSFAHEIYSNKKTSLKPYLSFLNVIKNSSLLKSKNISMHTSLLMNTSINLGLGLMAEQIVLDDLSLNLMLGYAFYHGFLMEGYFMSFGFGLYYLL